MIAKLVVHAPDRAQAAVKLAAACRAVEVWPVKTNAAFLARAAADPDFVAGRVDTGFIERHAARLVPGAEPDEAVLQAAARALLPNDAHDPWTALVGFRMAGPACRDIAVEVAGRTYLVTLDDPAQPAPRTVTLPSGERVLFLNGEAWVFCLPRPDRLTGGGAADGALLAPMPGRVIAVETQAGARVRQGERLVVLEAMKMEQGLVAPFDGVVAELKASVGAQVSEGALLVRIERASDGP